MNSVWYGTTTRRLTSRTKASGDLWVVWRCQGRDDVSRVGNLSAGGVFIETRRRWPVGTAAQIAFLVPEGQIRAEAVVRHSRPGEGVGLKFTALTDQDRPHLAALMRRQNEWARAEKQR